MSTEKNILWIDDRINLSSMRGYRVRLEEKGFKVTPEETIDDALDLLQDTNRNWAGMIVDISIPPSRETKGKAAVFGSGETENGRRLGYVLLKRIDEDDDFEHLRGVPKIVFTQVDDNELGKYCESKNIPLLRRTVDKNIEDLAQEHFQGKKI